MTLADALDAAEKTADLLGRPVYVYNRFHRLDLDLPPGDHAAIFGYAVDDAYVRERDQFTVVPDK